MPYGNIDDGLYLIKQKSRIKPNLIEHYGILDIGNILNHPQNQIKEPLIIHQAYPTIRIDWLAHTGKWKIEGKVKNEFLNDAIDRIQKAVEDPYYNLFGNNCEHFARYVTSGKKESKQLQVVGGIALTAILILLWKIRQ